VKSATSTELKCLTWDADASEAPYAAHVDSAAGVTVAVPEKGVDFYEMYQFQCAQMDSQYLNSNGAINDGDEGVCTDNNQLNNGFEYFVNTDFNTASATCGWQLSTCACCARRINTAPRWTLVMHQKLPDVFSRREWAKNEDDSTANAYSILHRLETLRHPDGELKFKLNWPNTSFYAQVCFFLVLNRRIEQSVEDCVVGHKRGLRLSQLKRK
jgi:hypothetical protein